MAWSVEWAIFVDDTDLSTDMRPYLLDISVVDKAGFSSDMCNLTFDDMNAQITMPVPGGKLRVYLNGAQVFKGVVDSVRSIGSRSAGRVLKVGAKGFDDRGKAKQPQTFHKDNASLKEFMETSAGKAGFEMIVDDDLAKIVSDYWAADGESFLAIGASMAKRFNATFKLRDDKAVLVPKGKDNKLPPVIGRVGVDNSNVLSWDIAPLQGRSQFSGVSAEYFDRKKGDFQFARVEGLTDKASEAVNKVKGGAASGSEAKDVTTAQGKKIAFEGGEGRVGLILTPEAQAEGLFKLLGARPGINGDYRIASVTHNADRRGGSTTNLEIRHPQNTSQDKAPKKKSDGDGFDFAPVDFNEG